MVFNITSALIDNIALILDNVRLARRRNTGKSYDINNQNESSSHNQNNNQGKAEEVFRVSSTNNINDLNKNLDVDNIDNNTTTTTTKDNHYHHTTSQVKTTHKTSDDEIDLAMEAMAFSAVVTTSQQDDTKQQQLSYLIENICGSSCTAWLETKTRHKGGRPVNHHLPTFQELQRKKKEEESDDIDEDRNQTTKRTNKKIQNNETFVPHGDIGNLLKNNKNDSFENTDLYENTEMLNIIIDGYKPLRNIQLISSGIQLLHLIPIKKYETNHSLNSTSRGGGGGVRNSTDERNHENKSSQYGMQKALALVIELKLHSSSHYPTSSLSDTQNRHNQNHNQNRQNPKTSPQLNKKQKHGNNMISESTCIGLITIRTNSKFINSTCSRLELLLPQPSTNSKLEALKDFFNLGLSDDENDNENDEENDENRTKENSNNRIDDKEAKEEEEEVNTNSNNNDMWTISTIEPGGELWLPHPVLQSGDFRLKSISDDSFLHVKLPATFFQSNENHESLNHLSLPSSHRFDLDRYSMAIYKTSLPNLIDNDTYENDSILNRTTSPPSLSSPSSSDQSSLCEWVISSLPHYSIVNSLPCSLEYQAIQPPSNSSSSSFFTSSEQNEENNDDLYRKKRNQEEMKQNNGNLRDAMRLFHKYDTASSTTSSAPSSSFENVKNVKKEKENENKNRITIIDHQVVEMGDKIEIRNVSLDRPLYIRIRISSLTLWSVPIVFTKASHTIRQCFDGSCESIHLSNVNEKASVEQHTTYGSGVHYDNDYDDGGGSGNGISSISSGSGDVDSIKENIPEIQVAKVWKQNQGRSLLFHSRFWILNKTSIALWYQAEGMSPASNLTNKLTNKIKKSTSTASGSVNNETKDKKSLSSSTKFSVSSSTATSYDAEHLKAKSTSFSSSSSSSSSSTLSSTSSLTSTIVDNTVASLYSLKKEVSLLSDGQNCEYFGITPNTTTDFTLHASTTTTTSSSSSSFSSSMKQSKEYEEDATSFVTPQKNNTIFNKDKNMKTIKKKKKKIKLNECFPTMPVMLNCPNQKLRIMPYGHSDQANELDLLYVSNIIINNNEKNQPYCMKTDFNIGDYVYMEEGDNNQPSDQINNSYVTSFPDILLNRQIVAIQTKNSDRYVSRTCLDHLKFKVSCDADVFVCYDSKARKPPDWLKTEGFRNTSSRIKTNECIYTLYYRFYSKGTEVKLGGGEAKRSIIEGFKNYFILLSSPLLYMKKYEISINNIIINRNLAESTVCREKPCFLCRYQTGDLLYCDRPYIINKIPTPLLKQPNLVALLTAQSDKRSI